MEECVLKVRNVSKKYKSITVLNGINLSMNQGRIYGLIGKNGAGKTTLMRLIAGLSFANEGSIELFGHAGRKAFTAELKRIGSLIEYPAMNSNMTARENMKLHRIIRGIPDKSRDIELLELVGLHDTGRRKVKDFSLGMRQRLGIAIALIGSPELLILDEPVNGLDPIGVVEIRNLIRDICEQRHITVLISSHNLPELFQTATDYIIIDKGEIKQTLTLEELEECCKHYLAIQCDEPEKLVQILESRLHTENYKVMPDKTVRLYDYQEELKKVSLTLYENGIIPVRFVREGETLEKYFLSVIGGERCD